MAVPKLDVWEHDPATDKGSSVTADPAVVKAVQASHDSWRKFQENGGKGQLRGFTATVPTDQMDRTVALIRKSAYTLPGVGLKVTHTSNNDGTVSVHFQAQDKRNYDK